MPSALRLGQRLRILRPMDLGLEEVFKPGDVAIVAQPSPGYGLPALISPVGHPDDEWEISELSVDTRVVTFAYDLDDEARILEKLHRPTLDNAPTGMYLQLLHGRNDPDEDMDDWGFHGGYIGPLQWAHTTYLHHFRINPHDSLGLDHEDYNLTLHDDMLRFNGAYYGDWSLFVHDPDDKLA